MTDEYVLGTHSEELERLGLQHQVWQADTATLWRRAGFGPGDIILDAGCGPGFSTVDLAGLVGATGRVVALDRDAGYVDATRQRAAALGYVNVEVHEATVSEPLERVPPVDGAFLRWVLSFLSAPQDAVAHVAERLAPGGALVAMDYCHYRAARVYPRSDVLDQLFVEFDAANAAAGGSFDHGEGMAAWALASGLEVASLQPIVHAARPGGRYWFWFTAFCRVFVPAMVERGQIAPTFATQVVEALRDTERAPGAFLLTPPVMTLIARRPSDEPPRR